MPRLFVTPPDFGRHSPAARRRLDASGWQVDYNPQPELLSAEAIRDLASDAEAVIVGTEPLAPLVATSTSLRLIARTGVGLDALPLAECRRRGISVTYVASAATTPVAELTLSSLLALLRQGPAVGADLRRGVWQRRLGRTLAECTVGIVGLGRIGTRLAEFLTAFAPGRVLVCDIEDRSETLERLRQRGLSVTQVPLDQLAEQSDAISLHVPLWSATRQLFDTARIASMRPGALLLNYARGGLLDETALDQALRTGQLGGAALDTFADEPQIGALATAPNLILTPHVGAYTARCREQMESDAVDSVLRFLDGRALPGLVPEQEYRYQAAP